MPFSCDLHRCLLWRWESGLECDTCIAHQCVQPSAIELLQHLCSCCADALEALKVAFNLCDFATALGALFSDLGAGVRGPSGRAIQCQHMGALLDKRLHGMEAHACTRLKALNPSTS